GAVLHEQVADGARAREQLRIEGLLAAVTDRVVPGLVPVGLLALLGVLAGELGALLDVALGRAGAARGEEEGGGQGQQEGLSLHEEVLWGRKVASCAGGERSGHAGAASGSLGRQRGRAIQPGSIPVCVETQPRSLPARRRWPRPRRSRGRRPGARGPGWRADARARDRPR